MASGIDVVFTGLMLICLDGQTDCPKGSYADKYQNTAWVVRADGGGKVPARVCGWYGGEETRLELRFSEDDFDWTTKVSPLIACERSNTNVACTFLVSDLCVDPKMLVLSSEAPRLADLLRLAEVDRRLSVPKSKRLEDSTYISNRIHFPRGAITAGPLWTVGRKPVRWYRSDGNMDQALPRALSDQMIVRYGPAEEIAVTDCSMALIDLKPKKESPRLVFRNVAVYPPTPNYETDEGGGYDTLAYLLWYYRLGEWDTYDGECPSYGRSKEAPTLLRCVSKGEGGCASDFGAPAESRFWPPVVGGSRGE